MLYQCRGNIYLSNKRYFCCDFECGQTEAGDIIVRTFNFDLAIWPFINDFDNAVYVSGYTSKGRYVRVNIDLSASKEMSLGATVSAAFEFYGRELLVGNMLAEPLTELKFYLVNFEFLQPLKWHLGGYEVSVKKVEGWQEAEKEMKVTERPKVTAEVTVTSSSQYISNEYEVERILHDLCSLLSLAKGCQIQWLYWDAFTLDRVLVKSYHWNGITTPHSGMQIILEIPRKDISDFVQQTFDHYREVNTQGVWQFDGAIGHYADTLSRNSLLEIRATNLVVLVDYLTQRFADHGNTTNFITPASFDEKNRDYAS
jgi:hypothetical protein